MCSILDRTASVMVIHNSTATTALPSGQKKTPSISKPSMDDNPIHLTHRLGHTGSPTSEGFGLDGHVDHNAYSGGALTLPVQNEQGMTPPSPELVRGGRSFNFNAARHRVSVFQANERTGQ
jgi:hypothetical protein